MNPPPIASPFGDLPKAAPPSSWPQPLRWDAQLGCFALHYRSPISAKLRCLPKELRRSPIQVLMLFVMSPLWFLWTIGLNLPLPLHILLALLLSPLGLFAIMLIQWSINKAPGQVMIRSDGLVDQFPAKTAIYLWPDITSSLADEGDLFFYVSATKGSYFPREAFASPADGELFFYLAESLRLNQGTNWSPLVREFAPQLPQS